MVRTWLGTLIKECTRTSTRQGQPKKYISAQRDMMDLKGGLFVFETKMTLDRS